MIIWFLLFFYRLFSPNFCTIRDFIWWYSAWEQSEGEVISHKIVSYEHVKSEIELGSNCFQNMEGLKFTVMGVFSSHKDFEIRGFRTELSLFL